MDRAEQLAVLSGPAADQWGLVTAAQAKGLGLSAVQLLRLAEAGLLDNVSRGVYLLAAGGMPRHVDIKAAWLRLQPGQFAWNRRAGHPDSGVVSHASACQLHELGDIPAPDVELTVPRRRTTTEPFVRLRTALLEPDEITLVDGLPVTTAARTITDLLKAKADGGHIGGVIAEAERRGLVAVDDLAERVQPYARKYGLKATATGRDLIDHLVAQSGESLRRQEVDRASQEGFDAAVQLFAEHPNVASYLAAGNADKVQRQLAQANARYTPSGLLQSYAAAAAALRKRLQPDPAALAAMRKAMTVDPALSALMRKATLPDPVVVEAARKLTALDPTLVATIRNAMALDPAVLQASRAVSALPEATRKALESADGVTASREPAPSPSQGGPGPASGDSRQEEEEAG